MVNATSNKSSACRLTQNAEPTDKQIHCVNIIVCILKIPPPTQFTKIAYTAFISQHIADSRRAAIERRKESKRVDELSIGDVSNIDDFVGQFRVLRGGC